ncbi:MAG: DeoR family transcriptional regulator [Candidatus Bathyarchaeota archaeon]|nr:DeoR family transcriptional regulator [Candidatus Bathyarchaeota archaeon]MDH5495448.1 DeoR family transcriptional regulator [Candidatus Bathyarchaeota archaeon]
MSETKKGKQEEEREERPGDFEVLAEWTIRRLRPLKDVSEEDHTENAKRWVLFALGLDKLHQDIFLYLEETFRSTTTDIASKFDISPNTARKYLDELHTVGLVDYVGREYALTYESLSRAIELMLIPRITDTLRTIARGASNADYYRARPFEGMDKQEVIVESGVTLINKQLLDSWYSQGKKVQIKSYAGLTVSDDVDPELFNAVIDRLKCMGGLRIPTEVYTRVAHKIRCYAGVDTY